MVERVRELCLMAGAVAWVLLLSAGASAAFARITSARERRERQRRLERITAGEARAWAIRQQRRRSEAELLRELDEMTWGQA